MVEIKSFGKRKGGAGSGAAGVSAGGSIGESVVREALHAAKADIALQAQKAAEAARAAVADYAAGAGHAATADMATEADHATSAYELDKGSPTRREFLSRKHADSAKKCINFIEGLTVGTDGEHGMKDTGDVKARDVTGRKVEADRGSFGDILMRYLSSVGFVSGLLGSGVGIWQDKAGKWHLDIDAITARQSLTVLELLIQRIRAVGGAVVLSQASGKVAEVVETGTGIGSDSYYRLYLEEGGDGDFMAGDLVRCSRWDGDSGDPERMHAYWEEAVKAEWDAARERRFVAIRRPTSTGTVPAAGDELVLMGNTRDKTRQGFIHLTVEAGKPRIAEWAGVNSAELKPEQMVTCLGDLDGIEWQGRTLEGVGYGLMTRNFYGTGEIVLKSGSTVEDAFAGLDERVQSMRQGSRNLVLNSGLWSPDRQITIVPGGSATGLPDHWRPLNDGCAAAVADGLLVLRKDTGTMPDGTAARRNGLVASVSRDPLPKGTVLTVRVKGEAGNIVGGKRIRFVLYSVDAEGHWGDNVTLGVVTDNGKVNLEETVTLAADYTAPRLCVSLLYANEGAYIKLESVGLYAGTRAPELWTPAPEDIEERQAAATGAAKAAAAEAQRTADAATVAASGAQASVGELEGYVNEAFRDGIITEMEAAAIAKYTNTVNTASENLASTYNALHGNPYLTGTAKTALENAYRVVSTAVSVLLQTIRDVTADSKITGKEPEAVDAAFAAFNTASGDFSTAVEDANKAIQATLGDASAAAKAAADAAKRDAKDAKDAADEAAKNAVKAVADLQYDVEHSIKDGILTDAEKASIGRYVKIVEGARDEVVATVGAILDNSHLPAAFQDSLFIAEGTTVKAAETLLGYVDNTVNGKWPESVTDEQAMGLVNDAFDAYNSAMAALRKEIEAANAAIQSAIEAEAREAADKAAQAVADGLSVRNLVPMSGLWESVPGKDDGWGMLNDGCVASVGDHRLWMVKDGDGRNGMWAQLTVPSLPKGRKVTIRVKGKVDRDFAPGTNDDGTPRRVLITLYNTSPGWTHNVPLADIREKGEFELTRTVELGQDYSVPKLCFSMQNAPEGTGLRLDWVALYAGSWAPEGWNPAPEDAQRIVTVRDVKLTGEFTARADELSQSIESSVTEYRTRFGALRNLLVATRQENTDGSPLSDADGRPIIANTASLTVGVGKGGFYNLSRPLEEGTYTLTIETWGSHYPFSQAGIALGMKGIPDAIVGWRRITLNANKGVTVARIDIPSTPPSDMTDAEWRRALLSARLTVALPSGVTAEGELRGIKLAAGDIATAYTAAPEDAVTYREETHTLFSVTDGLIKTEVSKVREDAAASRGNLLMSYRDGETLHTTATATTSDSGGFIAYPLSVPLTRGGDYTFSIEGWGVAMGQKGLSVRLQGAASPHHAICGGTTPLDVAGRNLVTLHVPDSGGTFLDDDLASAELQVATLHHPSVVAFSKAQLVAGAYDATTMPAWSEAAQDAAMLRDMLREETATMIEQTNDKITLSATETKKELRGELGTQTSELRSEIAVGTRLISLSVGEKAIPLGSAPYHNLLRHTNQGVTGWTVANSTEGAGAFLIQRQPWANGMDFVKLRRQGTAPSDSSGWEWMRFDGLAPKALQPGKYRLQFHMLAYAQGTFGLTFLPQDTTATGDNTADNLCSAASVPVPVSQMADYSHPDLGPVKKIQKDFDVTLNVTRQGSLDVGNLRIGTTGRANILVLVIGNLRLTKGEEFREWTPSTADYADGLRRTGIDIVQRKITLTSDTVEVKNNDGETTALIDEDGMLETSLVRAEELQTNRFIITDGEGRKVISDNEHGDGARVFYYTDDFPDVTDEAVGVQPMFRVGYDPVTKTFMQHYNPDGTIAWTIGKAGTPTAATLPYSWNDFRLAKITSEGAARNTRDMGGASYHMFRSTSRQDNPERPGEAYADSNGRLFTARSTKASVIADGLYCDSAVGKFTGKNAELEPEGPTVKAASRPATQGIVTTWSRTVYTVAGGRITDSERITWTTGGTLLPES